MKLKLALTLLLTLCAAGAFADCTTPAAPAGRVIFNTTTKTMQYCNGTNWVNTGASVPGATQSGCATPVGKAGAVTYNSTLGVVQFCNGQNWVDTACAADRTPGGSGCTGGKTGIMRYATSVNELQFCDSTNWVAMGWGCSGGTPPAPGGTTDWSVAAKTQTIASDGGLAVEGNTALFIGADSTVSIYLKSGGTWTKQATTFANLSSGFGAILNSNTIIGANPTENSNQGAVYVYTGSGASWSQQQRIVPADAVADDQFGINLSLSGDTFAALSGPNDEYIYIYTRTGSVWSLQQKITTTGVLPFFGIESGMVLEGNTMAVAMGGAVDIWTRSGSTWTKRTTISSPGTNDGFGQGLSLSGNTLAIAAVADTNARGTNAGAVYIYTGSGASWSQQAKIVPADLRAKDNFGLGMDLSGDVLVAGATAYLDLLMGGTPVNGNVYIYTRSGSTWTQTRKITGTEPYHGIILFTDAITLLLETLDLDTYVGTTYVYGQ